MKLKLTTTEEELELIKTQSLKALEDERHRCSEEIERMRNAFSERLSEGHEREVAMSEEISQLQVRPCLSFLPRSLTHDLTVRGIGRLPRGGFV
jgi:hypothetical protein